MRMGRKIRTGAYIMPFWPKLRKDVWRCWNRHHFGGVRLRFLGLGSDTRHANTMSQTYERSAHWKAWQHVARRRELPF